MNETLREFQTEARHKMNALLNAGRSPVFISPTGTGKSRTIAAIIADRIRLKRRVFLLCPTDETFRQWTEELVLWGLNPGTIDQQGVQGRNRDVYICMYKSLSNLLNLLPESFYPDEIAIDELHHFPTATIESVHSFFPKVKWFGCTATLYRGDGKGFNHIFSDIVQTITMRQAIAKGYLAKPLIIVPQLYLDKISIKDGEYDPQEQIAKLGQAQIVGDVIENYGHIFGGKQVLVACCSFDHAKDMAFEFCKAGWNFRHIHGLLPKNERRKMIREIRNGEINGLTTYAVGTEGANIVGLAGLIWMRRTASLTVYLQYCGRCLRPAEGKEHGIILDPVGNLFIHGFPEADRVWSLAGSGDPRGQGDGELDTSRQRICPFCGVANAAVNSVCHFCGKELDSEEARQARARRLPAMVDGKLVAVASDGQQEEIRARAERIRLEQGAAAAEEARRGVADGAEEIGTDGKARALRKGLFSVRRKMFAEAVKQYL